MSCRTFIWSFYLVYFGCQLSFNHCSRVLPQCTCIYTNNALRVLINFNKGNFLNFFIFYRTIFGGVIEPRSQAGQLLQPAELTMSAESGKLLIWRLWSVVNSKTRLRLLYLLREVRESRAMLRIETARIKSDKHQFAAVRSSGLLSSSSSHFNRVKLHRLLRDFIGRAPTALTSRYFNWVRRQSASKSDPPVTISMVRHVRCVSTSVLMRYTLINFMDSRLRKCTMNLASK
jgi:hypothetical protein